MKKTVVAIYHDPDFYPPTINAILNLAEVFEEVKVISMNNSKYQFPFPAHVKLHKIGKPVSVRAFEKRSVLFKAIAFLRFTGALCRACFSSRVKLVLLYDSIPLFSWKLASFFLPAKKKVWYHNHDMPSFERQRKFSVGWFAAKYEHSSMKKIDFFSLPSSDRLLFYPALDTAVPFFFLPNYPSLKVYKERPPQHTDAGTVKIIFQGFIGPNHTIEEMVGLLAGNISGKKMQLVLKGSVKDEYKEKIVALAGQLGVIDAVKWIGIGPYNELPALTASCYAGLAVHLSSDNVSKTLGTASNKIYEYAASGLPVILYDNEQFKKYLGKYRWAFFIDGSAASLKNALEQIVSVRNELSLQARYDFEEALNFEKYFKPALQQVLAEIKTAG